VGRAHLRETFTTPTVRGTPASLIGSELSSLRSSGLSLRPDALSSPPLWSLRWAHNSHDMGIPLPEHLVLSGRTDADSRGVVNFACTEFYEVSYLQATPSQGKEIWPTCL
jgi:hypothetical protein